jgi:hypothetical protein
VPPVILKIDSDAPALNLAPVQFRNWDRPGIAIRADKAAQHAGNLRLIADGMTATDRHFADYLRRFAGQLSPETGKGRALVDEPPGVAEGPRSESGTGKPGPDPEAA